MRPAGLAQVELAKADGRWAAAYAGQSQTVPDADLQASLDADPAARGLFDALDAANRYAVLYRVQPAVTIEQHLGHAGGRPARRRSAPSAVCSLRKVRPAASPLKEIRVVTSAFG